jgi:hypothetical protein
LDSSVGCTGLPIAHVPIDLEKELGRKTADEEGEDPVVKIEEVRRILPLHASAK